MALGAGPSTFGSLWWRCLPVFIVSAALKVLLFPSYASTDFDVHRNWLAITHHIPITKWYHEATSIWTLDYPPLFAWLEWVLARAAMTLGLRPILELSANPIRTTAALLFQRVSVLAGELVLFSAICAFSSVTKQAWGSAETISIPARCALLCAVVLLHPGLVLVDNIHFQYNGLLFALLLFALTAAYAGRPLVAALLFLGLVCTKHLFAVLGPVVAVYALAHGVFKPNSSWRAAVCRLLVLAGGAAVAFLLTFAPVLVDPQAIALCAATGDAAPPGEWAECAAASVRDNFLQLAARLFPFSRGLVHAYWAPNAWALYMAADKVLAAVRLKFSALSRVLPLHHDDGVAGSTASGLQALPAVTPALCALITVVTIIPIAWALSRYLLHTERDSEKIDPAEQGAAEPNRGQKAALPSDHADQRALPARCTRDFDAASCLHIATAASYACAFAFGWHTHEKAVLYVLIPLLVLLLGLPQGAPALRNAAWLMHVAGCVSLTPLIFTPLEQPVVLLHFLVYSLALRALLFGTGRECGRGSGAAAASTSSGWTSWLWWLYGGALAGAYILLQLCYADSLALCRRLPFAPLLCMSAVCAAGIGASFCWLYAAALFHNRSAHRLRG
jgi:alpha-1,3-glucosyltransferase